MKWLKKLNGAFVGRNLFALALLIVAYFISDRNHFFLREGAYRYLPYFFLILLFCWVVFHNRILFEGLYLKGNQRSYIKWTALAMIVSSLNMFVILRFMFSVRDPLPHILTFWVFTLAGLGVFLVHRFGRKQPIKPDEIPTRHNADFYLSGMTKPISSSTIEYVESMENYVRIKISTGKVEIVRCTLKEAEKILALSNFLRISRSHIVNLDLVRHFTGNEIILGNQTFQVGKVYKRYVEQALAGRFAGAL